jgi:hypothetical protein
MTTSKSRFVYRAVEQLVMLHEAFPFATPVIPFQLFCRPPSGRARPTLVVCGQRSMVFTALTYTTAACTAQLEPLRQGRGPVP